MTTTAEGAAKRATDWLGAVVAGVPRAHSVPPSASLLSLYTALTALAALLRTCPCLVLCSLTLALLPRNDPTASMVEFSSRPSGAFAVVYLFFFFCFFTVSMDSHQGLSALTTTATATIVVTDFATGLAVQGLAEGQTHPLASPHRPPRRPRARRRHPLPRGRDLPPQVRLRLLRAPSPLFFAPRPLPSFPSPRILPSFIDVVSLMGGSLLNSSRRGGG